MSDLQEFWHTFNRITHKFSKGGIGLNPRLYTISRARQVYESEGKGLTAEHLLAALDEDGQGVEFTIEEAEMLIKTYLTDPDLTYK